MQGKRQKRKSKIKKRKKTNKAGAKMMEEITRIKTRWPIGI